MTTETSGGLGAYTAARPVQDHIRMLAAERIGLPRVAELSGVSYATLGHLMYGSPGRGRAPSARVRERIAARILAVTPGLAALAGHALVDATPTRRRVQVLVARGHTERRIAPLVPVERSRLCRIARGEEAMVTARVARGVHAAYDQLWDEPPPAATPAQRTVTTKARRRASGRGWPVTWDGDLAAVEDLGDIGPDWSPFCAPPSWRAEYDLEMADAAALDTARARELVAA